MIASREGPGRRSTAAARRSRRSESRSAASGDGTASSGRRSSAARCASPALRPADRTLLRASFATIASSHGLNGAPSRKRASAAWALTNASWAASSASAAERVMAHAVRNAIVWCILTMSSYAPGSPRFARATSVASCGGRSSTVPVLLRQRRTGSGSACPVVAAEAQPLEERAPYAGQPRVAHRDGCERYQHPPLQRAGVIAQAALRLGPAVALQPPVHVRE